LHEIFRERWQWANEQLIKFWWLSGHHLDTGIVFRIHYCWDVRKVVSTDCAARQCSTGHALALAGIARATMTLLRHRPMTDSGTDIATLVRRALAEVCTVPVFLVIHCVAVEISNRLYRANSLALASPAMGHWDTCPFTFNNVILWPPCIADADIIFLSGGFFYLLLSSIFFHRLISAVVDWMSTILPHKVRI